MPDPGLCLLTMVLFYVVFIHLKLNENFYQMKGLGGHYMLLLHVNIFHCGYSDISVALF